jgi:hypothetical protein
MIAAQQAKEKSQRAIKGNWLLAAFVSGKTWHVADVFQVVIAAATNAQPSLRDSPLEVSADCADVRRSIFDQESRR